MAIEFTCPACGGTLRVRDTTVGQVVRCGGCLTMLRVPDVEPVHETPSAEPTFPGPRSAAPASAPLAPEFQTTPPSQPQLESPTLEAAPRRGLRFWLLVTAGVFVIGGICCLGLAAFLLPGPDWQVYDSPLGGYKVELPAEPRNDMAKRLNLLAGGTTEGTFLWTRAENYAIIFWEIPRAQRDPQLLDEQVKKLTSKENIRSVTRNEPVVVSGFPGREFEFRYKNGGTVTARVVLADTRMYVLWGGGRFTRPGNSNIRRFLDSFEITDQKLVAGAPRLKAAAAIVAAAAFKVVTAEQNRK